MSETESKVEPPSDQKKDKEQTQPKDCRRHSFREIFQELTGYRVDNFRSLNNFTQWLHRPVDGAALGVFRMLFGAAMLVDIAEERGGGQMDLRFGEPQHCHFPLFHGLSAFSFPIMGLVYLCMWLGAIGIMLGYRFRLSCLAFVVPYWYIFLLDKPAWNNHSYLFGLCGSMLLFTNANCYCSLDRYLNPAMPSTVPYWNYFLIKFQFFLLYTYAGLKKLTAEWLSGYAMSSLSRHWVFTPFRSVLSAEMIDLLIVHWFTAIFDFSIAFFMTWQRTRLLVTPFMLSFHLMNSRLFVIGMFPWVCLAEVPMFFGFDWPRSLSWRRCLNIGLGGATKKPIEAKKIMKRTTEYETDLIARESELIVRESDLSRKEVDLNPRESNLRPTESDLIARESNLRPTESDLNQESDDHKLKTMEPEPDLSPKSLQDDDKDTPKVKQARFTDKLRSLIVLAYCGLQLFLPYSHFITKGYNNWTNGLYGYSWDMMVHSYDTILTSIKIVDNDNGNVHLLNPYAFTEYDRWTKYADMAHQYAKCIEANILEDYARNAKDSPLSSTNFSIYFDIWCSMNGRFQQRVFDPRVDLLKAEWSPFERTPWSLPLLNELNHMRPKLKTIADEVLAWNNYSDVVFVADFPGLTLDNFISSDLTNVSLTILEGNVRYKSDDEDEAYFLTAGKSFALNAGVTHHVTTIGLKPSSYLYTYVNKTMLETQTVIDDAATAQSRKPMLPLWREFQDRIGNYKKFLMHMGNCLLFLLYDVPIPIELRERF